MRHLWREDKRRLGGLDLLRSAAVVSVVLVHYHIDNPLPIPFIQYGWIGVDLFFVLSGYLIGDQLLNLQAKHQAIPLKTFYMRRFLRTLPNYYFVLAIYLIVPGLSPLTSFKEKLVYLWQYATFTQNLTVVLPFFQVSWSLCVEEHFYLLLPLLIGLFLKKRSKWIGWVFPLVILAEPALRALIVFYGINKLNIASQSDILAYLSHIYYPTYCRLDGLTIGVALAALRHYRPGLWSRLMTHGNKLLLAGVISVFLAFLLLSSFSFAISGVVIFTVIALSFGLMTASALSPASILGRVKLRAITVLAELAYSIYLTHLIGFYLAKIALDVCGLNQHKGLSLIFTAVAVMGTALTLFTLVEYPCLQLRDRMFTYKKPGATGIASLTNQYNLPASSPAGR
jgi:peptidoglycan/LPS O-acetylase OafA/YrhL